jgi:hypothetical protein
MRIGLRLLIAGLVGVLTAGAIVAGVNRAAPQHRAPTVINAAIYEFYGPATSGVECELDVAGRMPGWNVATEAMCLTVDPARSVTMDEAGHVEVCDGAQCLSNAGLGTPTLNPGTTLVDGPFTCHISAFEVACRVAHRGFSLSTRGVRLG